MTIFASKVGPRATLIGGQRLFCPFENLENSRNAGDRVKVVAPDDCISQGKLKSAARWIYANGCELTTSEKAR